MVAVLLASDIPGANECSPSLGGDPVLADSEVLFHGQVVFAVAATSRRDARRAARLARIDVEEVAPAVDVDAGIRSGRQVLPPYEFRRGAPRDAIAASPRIHEGSVRIGGQEHFYLEGQAALAIPGEAGEMFLHSSTQHPSDVQRLVARMLGVPLARVVCECRRMGGASAARSRRPRSGPASPRLPLT